MYELHASGGAPKDGSLIDTRFSPAPLGIQGTLTHVNACI